MYYSEIKRKKMIRDHIAQILGVKNRGRPFDYSEMASPSSPQTCISIRQIYEPFSQTVSDAKELEAEFEHLKILQLADILPWRAMLQDELKEPKTFSVLNVYTNKTREEKIVKFQHILMMQSSGQVSIRQTEPFGDIIIEPKQIHQDSDIIIKDRQGNDCTFVWGSLSNTQRNKIIADIQASRIICRSA
jgi:hypothetical protein